jgi:hypothetical protein
MKKTFVRLFLLLPFLSSLFLSSCQKELEFPPMQIELVNPGFELRLTGWKIETAYTGWYGFSSDTMARINGDFGLNFYASQPEHFPGAPQDTPWNGKIYQTVTGLPDGKYTFKAYADAVGTGMYLWANGGPQTPEVKVAIKSDVNELNTLDFTVKGGTAQIGFICINASGNPLILAPYFHADDVELWTR